MKKLALSFVVLFLAACATTPAKSNEPYGILLLAHGGSQRWNESVADVAKSVDANVPTEVAFGMAQRSAMQSAVERLEARGVKRIVAVPLFVSSHSSVITSTEFLLGKRRTAPKDLADFAGMSHGPGGEMHHDMSKMEDGTKPVKTAVPILMTNALNAHPIVADILASRVQSLAGDPAGEVVILVAHGPTEEDENRRWLADMSKLVKEMKSLQNFHRVELQTVRDDAEEPIRNAATAELRARVEKATAEGKRVIVIPLLISYGGIEKSIQKRLDGLKYEMPTQGLLPDPRIANWVRSMAGEAAGR
ncbi:MAG: hypothetical protein JOZ54_03105 [Acidobacteria bacterium]|nr:hypothetical protein [Acidobacteriota bacterium]